jgi:hypothetical protein
VVSSHRILWGGGEVGGVLSAMYLSCDPCWLVMEFYGPMRMHDLEVRQTFPGSLVCVVTTVKALE